MNYHSIFWPVLFLCTVLGIFCAAQSASANEPPSTPGFYTQTQTSDSGGIFGRVENAVLTHALAIERDRTRVFRATLDAAGHQFTFANLPVGRYDLFFVSADGRIFEGLALGNTNIPVSAPGPHLTERIAKADSFFNRYQIHAIGTENDLAHVLVERIRDKSILRQSGEPLGAWLRRFEIITLQQAEEDWQMLQSRHLYREEIPITSATSFSTHHHLAILSGLRIADNQRDLGTVSLP